MNIGGTRRLPGDYPPGMDAGSCFDLTREEWMLDAKCRGMGPDLFFPERGATMESRLAAETCEGCPVKARCLLYAIDTCTRSGVWGGKSERQRRMIRRDPVKVVFVRLAAEAEAGSLEAEAS